MHTTKLKIQGYRSLKDAIWEPSRLNILIGPNGSGKSNLLKVLELLSAGARGQLGTHIQNAGGISPLLWDGKQEKIALELYSSDVDCGHTDVADCLKYQLVLSQLRGGSTYRIDHEQLSDCPGGSISVNGEPFNYLKRNLQQAVVRYKEKPEDQHMTAERIQQEETMVSLASNPFIASKVIDIFQKQLELWTLYQAVDFSAESAVRAPVVTRYETTVSRDARNLINVLHTRYAESRAFKQDINDAMTAAFGSEFEELVFAPAADQRIQLKIRWKSLQREQSCADISDGTLRFLFLLAVLGNPDPLPLIGIDEPELGLHPSMLPIIAEFAVEASTRTQIVLTTHSPELLRAFSETKARITVVSNQEGATILENVNEAVLGKWLESYSLGDLYRSGELETAFKD